ncbi:WD40-repeat-containing domain protein [Cryomyces antarcticus]
MSDVLRKTSASFRAKSRLVGERGHRRRPRGPKKVRCRGRTVALEQDRHRQFPQGRTALPRTRTRSLPTNDHRVRSCQNHGLEQRLPAHMPSAHVLPTHDTPSPPTGPVPGRGLTQPPIFPADPNQGASARAAAALQNEQHHTAKPQMVDLQRRDTAKSSRVVVLPRDADSEDVSDSVAHMPRVDPVSYLPVELTALVFENLDAKSLARAQCVSKTWHHAAMSRHVWREVFLARYLKKPAVSPPPPQIGGKGIGKRRPEQDWQRMHKARKIIDRNWNAGDGKAIYMAGHTDSVYCVQFDEEKIITGSRDRTIRVWDINTYKCLRVIGGPATRPVPGPKELKAVEPPFLHHVEPSVNGTPAGDSIFHVPSDYHSASILCLQYDDEIMVTGSSDSTLIVWDIKTYEPIKRLVKHASGVLDVAFDDNYIVSCSKDSTITIWDRKTLEPKQVLHGHKGPVNAVQLRGNLLVSASGDGIAKLWNLGNGTGPAHPVREFNSKDRGLAAVEFSEDANYVLAGGNDHITYKFDTNTGAEVHTYLGHTNLVRSLYLDAHNNRVISGSYDLSLRVYDYADDPAQGQRGGREIAVFPEWTTSWMLAAKSDYRRIVSTSQDGRILMIDFGLDVDGAEMLEGRCS